MDENINVRFLRDEEKEIRNNKPESPIVLEVKPNQKVDIEFFLTKNSTDIKAMVTQHGAMLLRGFDISSEADCERALVAIEGFKPMAGYFMSELGRTLVEGSKYVYYTNKLFKTGGSFKFGGMHTENYYSCDVPQYITFYCMKPSLFGGETGLVDMAGVYEDFDDSIKDKLTTKPFWVSSTTVSSIARRYAVTEEQVKNVCSDFGLPVDTSPDGVEFVSLYKPGVCYHPVSKVPAFTINLSTEIQGLDNALTKEFKTSYKGAKWFLHQLVWGNKTLTKISGLNIRNVSKAISARFKPKAPAAGNQSFKELLKTIHTTRVGSVFTGNEVTKLAKSMRNNFTAFKWQKGDILIVDNFRMAHTGLPGMGPRVIRAILLNPVQLKYASTDPGVQHVQNNPAHNPLADIVENITGIQTVQL